MNEVEELEAITIPTKIRYKNIIWIPEQKVNQTKKNKDKQVIKQNYFIKWLNKNKQVDDIFTLEEFYKEYPKHKRNRLCINRIEVVLSRMIHDKELVQLGNDKFQVLK